MSGEVPGILRNLGENRNILKIRQIEMSCVNNLMSIGRATQISLNLCFSIPRHLDAMQCQIK